MKICRNYEEIGVTPFARMYLIEPVENDLMCKNRLADDDLVELGIRNKAQHLPADAEMSFDTVLGD